MASWAGCLSEESFFVQRGLGVRSVDNKLLCWNRPAGDKLSSMFIRVYENVLPTKEKGGSFVRVVSPIIRVLHLVPFHVAVSVRGI